MSAVALLTISAASGCAVSEHDAPVATGPRTIPVEPRVVLDGLIALSSRADRIVVDQVLFHAPTVTLKTGDRYDADVLASDPTNESPLFFRYDAGSKDAFGDVLGGERHWHLGDSTANGAHEALTFGFEPLAQVGEVADLERQTGVDLGELVEHTAVVHGYVLAAAGTAGGFTNGEGDPDGNPAHPSGVGAKTEGDPDGNPAHPGGVKGKSEGDPDGNPAHPGSGPRAADQRGHNQEGDPDGNPATGTEGASSGKHVDTGLADVGQRVGAHVEGTYTQTPFFLVFDDTFSLAVPVEDVLAGEVGADQVLPIDLHVAVDRLLDDDVVQSLESTDARAGTIVMQMTGASATHAVGIDVQANGVTRVRQSVTTGGIHIAVDHH